MYVMYPQQRLCLTVFLFQENKSFGASYHLHSSSDVREVVSRTILMEFTWIFFTSFDSMLSMTERSLDSFRCYAVVFDSAMTRAN
jgi:hypothetical protein